MSVVVCALTVMRNYRLFHNKGAANFPHLQPMAELRRNRRGEIGHQVLKVHYAAASLHVWSHLTHPDQWRHNSDRPWHRGLLRLLLSSSNVTGSFPTDVKDGGVKANSLTSPPNDAIICTEKGILVTVSMISRYLKTLVNSPAGVWTDGLPRSSPARVQLG